MGALTALLALYKAVTGSPGDGDVAYGRPELTSMASHTVVAFTLLGMACPPSPGAPRGCGSPWGAGYWRVRALGLAIFVGLGVISYRSARRSADTMASVRQTIRVLSTLQQVDKDVTEVQTTVRGYVITGREDFLAPYQEALQRLDDDERMLSRLTADNPVQHVRFETLEDLIHQRKAFSAQTLELRRRQGVGPAASLISTGGGHEIMLQIALVVDAMVREERSLLARRDAESRAVTARAFLILPAGTFIGVSVLLAMLFILNSEALERHQAELANRNAASIVESTDDAVIAKTLGGIITSWNPGAQRIFGYTAEEAIGQPVLMFIPPERASEEDAILARIARGEHVEHFETVRTAKDGRRLDVSVAVSPIRDEQGGVLGACKILRDVTERKHLAEQLRSAEERTRFALDTVGVGAWDLDLTDHTAYRTLGHDRIFGYDALLPQWTYEMFLEHVWPDDRAEVDRRFREAIAAQGDWSLDCRIRRADGELRWIWAAGRHRIDDTGQATHMAGVVQDITERRQTEQALRESEEHFRFLNDLAEATRTLADPAQIMAVTARMLGEHLRASRCAYADVEKDGEQFTILHDYTDGCASTVGSYQLSLFGARAVATLHSGQTLIIRNVEAELLPGEGADMFNAIGIKAIITCPLVKDGGLRAMMAVHQTTRAIGSRTRSPSFRMSSNVAGRRSSAGPRRNKSTS